MSLVTPERIRKPVTCITALLLIAAGGLYGGTAANEDEVRAAFLFQLAQYVHWPTNAAGPDNLPLRFCVLGQDRLTTKLEPTVRGKLIGSRAISVQRIASAKQLTSCDLAFIAFQSEKQIRATLTAWSYPPVLLVGEAEHFAEMGGIVNLVIQSGRVSFEINIAAAEQAHLEFRSQLLRFARIVGNERAAGEKGEKR